MIANQTQILESKCDEVELNDKLKITAHRFYTLKLTKNGEKRLLTDLLIVVGDIHITHTFAQTIQLKEELYLFDNGDEQNDYVFPIERTLNNKKVKSLVMKITETEVIYLSKSVAKTMVTILNNALIGFSLISLKNRDLRDEYALNIKDLFQKPKDE